MDKNTIYTVKAGMVDLLTTININKRDAAVLLIGVSEFLDTYIIEQPDKDYEKSKVLAKDYILGGNKDDK